MLSNTFRGVVWRSQCNGSERRERPVKISSDMQKDLTARKLVFIRITYIMPFKTSKEKSSKFKTFLRP